jgi:hypothetical protein
MQPTYITDITEDDKNSLYDMMDNDADVDAENGHQQEYI